MNYIISFLKKMSTTFEDSNWHLAFGNWQLKNSNLKTQILNKSEFRISKQ